MHSDRIVDEFTRQSATFNVSPVMHAAETLQTLLDLLPATADQRWLEVACGTGVIARALAPRVGAIHGVDLTPAMLAVAREETQKAGLANVTFSTGDATGLPFPDAHFDAAVTRFSLHHIPLPARCVAEMARVVRPGGWVAIGDHVTAEDQVVAAWHQEVERLRDPSHWASLTPTQIRRIGQRAGLELREERLIPFSLDFEEWLTRGSGGATARELVMLALREAPAGNDVFRVVSAANESPRLHLRYSLTLWQRG